MQFVCYQNGNFCSDISLPVSTLGFTRGYAAFELIRTYGLVPFCLKEHLNRLKNSAKLLEIPYPNNVEEVVYTLLEKNNRENILIRIYLSEDEISGQLHFLALAGPLTTPTIEQYQKGISVITTPIARQFHLAKSTSYLSAILALKEAARKNAEDAIYSPDDHLLELTKSNLFAVFKNTLYTAKDGVLPGITRGLVIELAKELEIPFNEAPLPLSTIPYLTEAFATSTTREILPISQINSTKIPLGPVTRLLCKHFLTCYQKPSKTISPSFSL